ncbi:phosphatase and actin regulator 2 isoform X3 [Xenopus laevis]|uniref:Phosphatase and actin regulator n=1 Tax=Xenopus laevis TaxID=8355 RepID=A0A8J0VBC3_XENLA|nr:phosphatase and actin regulator 2 isoform X3 [Xenopus laevis]
MGQTSVSTLSERGSSVDGLDKATFTNCDTQNSGNQTPPLKRKGRLSSIGKIFKPWKWRKKKASEKFIETSAVLERKISMRQSREELIRRGVLREIPDQDSDVPDNVGESNGHTVPISEEPPREKSPAAENGTVALKSHSLEEKVEDPTEQNKTTGAAQLKAKKTATSSKSTTHSPSQKKDDPPQRKTTKGITKQLSAPPPKTLSRPGTQEIVVSTNNKKTVAIKSSSLTPASSLSHLKSKQQVPSKTVSSGTHRAKKVGSTTNSMSTEEESQPTSSHTHSIGQKKTERTDQSFQNLDSEMPDVNQKKPVSSEENTSPHSISALKHEVKASCSIKIPEQEVGKFSQPVIICDISELPQTGTEGKTNQKGVDIPSDSEENEFRSQPLESQEDSSSLLSQDAIDDTSNTAINPDCDSEGKESQTSDSDSDGPILYTDDDDDDDDSSESTLASKIRRRDTLAIKLGNRPSKKDLEEKNILPRNSEEERQELWQQIGTKLVRRLSQRPTTEELEQRNILKQKNEEEEQEARKELKRRLTRKLSLRPSVAELQARRILCFNEYVEVTDSLDYDRRADKPWARLTPADKAAIRKELNEFKSTEMEVHEESRQFTRFHRP